MATCKSLELKPDAVSARDILRTSLEKPVVDLILAGTSNCCPCLIIISFGEVAISRVGGGMLTQLVNCLTSLDLYDSAV